MSQHLSMNGSARSSGHSKLQTSPTSNDSIRGSAPDDAPCGIFFQGAECPEAPADKTATPPLSETSSTKMARGLLRGIFNKATKTVSMKVARRPVMKSGCMGLPEIIPDFDIDDSTFEAVIFGEKLLISAFGAEGACPVPVGGLCLDVQAARGGPLKRAEGAMRDDDFLLPKFLVHLSSQFDFEGHNGGSRITAWVDRDLQTLEEKRREYVQLEDTGLEQKALYVISQDKFYYVRTNKKEDIYYSRQKAVNLIGEGSNFVLLRYLAIKKFVGTFETTTLYIDGSLCRNVYECKGPSSGVVNDKKLDVCKIYRTIIERCGIQHRCITLMSLHGQMLKQEWHLCDHILQLNPLAEIPEGKPSGPERIGLHGESDDLQLLSMYLDAKVSNKKKIKNYMEDHPEIKDVLGDYVQTILQLKPEEIFEFTAKYFLSFTPDLLPLTEYFEPHNDGGDEEDQDFEYWKYI